MVVVGASVVVVGASVVVVGASVVVVGASVVVVGASVVVVGAIVVVVSGGTTGSGGTMGVSRSMIWSMMPARSAGGGGVGARNAVSPPIDRASSDNPPDDWTLGDWAPGLAPSRPLRFNAEGCTITAFGSVLQSTTTRTTVTPVR